MPSHAIRGTMRRKFITFSLQRQQFFYGVKLFVIVTGVMFTSQAGRSLTLSSPDHSSVQHLVQLEGVSFLNSSRCLLACAIAIATGYS